MPLSPTTYSTTPSPHVCSSIPTIYSHTHTHTPSLYARKSQVSLSRKTTKWYRIQSISNTHARLTSFFSLAQSHQPRRRNIIQVGDKTMQSWAGCMGECDEKGKRPEKQKQSDACPQTHNSAMEHVESGRDRRIDRSADRASCDGESCT